MTALPHHPTRAVDDVVHQRHRLAVMVVLAEAGRADFGFLKRSIGLTDGNLGRHLQVLADAELVSIDKVFVDKRPRTWITITRKGRRHLDHELDAMQQILRRLRPGRTTTRRDAPLSERRDGACEDE